MPANSRAQVTGELSRRHGISAMCSSVFKTLLFIRNHPLGGWRGLGRFAVWQTLSFSHIRRTWTFEWVDGSRLTMERGSTGITGNWYVGLHEPEEMCFVLDFLKRGDLFVDVGANGGSYVVLAAAVAEAQVISFEPDPESYCLLQRNIELNDIGNQVRSLRMGVHSAPGEGALSRGLGPMNFLCVERPTDDAFLDVALTTLDEALQGDQPTMLKIDVEGTELHVLRGGAKTLMKDSLKCCLVELQNRAQPAQAEQIEDLLRDAGFVHYTFNASQRRLTRVSGQQGRNGIFIRDLSFVRARLSSAPRRKVLGRLMA